MTRLPGTWTSVELGEAGSWRGGGTPSKDVPEFWANGKVPWVSPKDMKVQVIRDSEDHITDRAVAHSAANRVAKGSVLVVTRSGILAHTLPVAVNAVEVTINQDLKALTPHNGIEAAFLAQGLRAFGSDILKGCKKDGTTVASIDFEGLQRYQIPLAPQNEQRRIVEAIDSYLTCLDAAVDSLERVQAKLKAYRASVLKAAVEGRLVPTEASLARAEKRDYEPAEVLLARILNERRRRWEEAELAKLKAAGKTPKDDKWKGRYEEPIALDTRQLPDLPEGWCWASPGQLSSADTYSLGIGPFGSSLKVSDYTTDGVPLVFVRNIRTEAFDDNSAAHYVSAKKADELRPHYVLPGDILITKMGDPPGDCCLYPLSRPLAIITADCIKLRLYPAAPSTGFFVHAIRSSIVQSQIQGITKGVAQKKVSLGRFRRIALPLAPATEQQQIADRLEALFSVANQTARGLEGSLQRCARLRQAILKWAFEGKLVDQDSADEPAEQLLARIRAARAAGSPTKKTSRRRTKGAA